MQISTNIGNNTEIGQNPLQNEREKPTNMKSVSKPILNFDGISMFSRSTDSTLPVIDLSDFYATCRAQAASPTMSAAKQNLVPRP